MNGKRDEKIRSRAYGIWEREGRPHGRNEHHWHQAIREVDDESSADKPAAPAAGPSGSTSTAPKKVAAPKKSTSPTAAVVQKAPAAKRPRTPKS